MSSSEVVPVVFRCPLTLDAIHSPVRLRGSGAKCAYEREALERWLEMQPRRDPVTNCQHEEFLTFEADEDLRASIVEWRKARGLPPTERPVFVRRSEAGKRWIEQLGRGDAAAVEEAARELANLCETDDAERVAARKHGGVDALLRVLRSATTADATKAAAARALSQLARNGDNRYAIANAGGIPPLVRMVQTHSDAMQEAGALALWRLARTYKDWIGVAVEPLVTVLESPCQPARLAAAKALWRLSVTDQHRAAICKAGGVGKLIRLIDHGACDATRQVAAWSLLNIACSTDRPVRARICRALGLHFVAILPSLDTIRRHLDRRVHRGSTVRVGRPRSLSPSRASSTSSTSSLPQRSPDTSPASLSIRRRHRSLRRACRSDPAQPVVQQRME
ncbi:hypothetical protein CTAYLR_004179 [Chrysophaeum taylorii]|uniref:RING-type E3 ubiquitin transferase n=1 Tax=Chrysophaeum taylorii TaxID=2483200 RepID=A0AAD7UMH8_9STRA|nr:hypothetical protein CTAYLR_004179 [Chrysophaeum taylorii]